MKFETAVILAGGKSSRMGFDKQFIKVKEEVLIYNMIKKLRSIFSEVIVVTNKPEHYKEINAKIVSDKIEKLGPLSGIHAGLENASSEYVYFIACDMPNINYEYIKHMKRKLSNNKYDGCVTQIGNWIEPFNSFYSKNITSKIVDYIESEGRAIFPLLKSLDVLYIPEKEARRFSNNWNMFFNLNTKDDLDEFLGDIG